MRIKDYTLAFARHDAIAITGHPIVIYCHTCRAKCVTGEIRATAGGVIVEGRWTAMTTEECVLFEETLARARVQAQWIIDHGVALSDAECDRLLGPIPFEV